MKNVETYYPMKTCLVKTTFYIYSNNLKKTNDEMKTRSHVIQSDSFKGVKRGMV